MSTSVFNVIGPIMIGPSSSHTAGAARIGRAARLICNEPFTRVTFGLHGSFAKTYKGHGTDIALMAGVLGMAEDDERIPQAFSIADESKIQYEFYETSLENVHENTVVVSFYSGEHQIQTMTGSSIGGGEIIINNLNGYDFEITARYPTLIIRHYDRHGAVSRITKILADYDINVGTLKLTRKAKGETACSVIETDESIPDDLVEMLKEQEHIISVQAIQISA